MQDSNADGIIYSCRTCLGLGTSKKVSTVLSFFINSHLNSRPVRYIDILLQLVPQMESTVSHTDRICVSCRKFLMLANEFIIQCLDVEEQLQHEHTANIELKEEELGGNLPNADEEEGSKVYLPDVGGEEEYLPEADGEDEEFGNQENIEIICEDDSVDQPQPVFEDHSYIKCEVEEENKFGPESVHKKRKWLESTTSTKAEMDTIPTKVIKKQRQTNTTSRGKYKVLKDQVPDEMLPCKICGKSYKGFDKLKMHLERHALVKRFGCRYCPMTYKLYSTLKKHELWHQQEDGIFLRCNVCWRRFTEEADLTNHMATRHANPRYECSYCEEKFHRKYLIDNHILLEHATPEDVELSHKTVVYDTLVELAEQAST